MDRDAAVPPRHTGSAGAGHAGGARVGHAGGARAGLQPSAASPRAGRGAPAGAGLCGRGHLPFSLQRPALCDCKGSGVSTRGFFWLPNPQLAVSTPRASKALGGSQTHIGSCGRSSRLASGWTIKQQIKFNMHKCKLERKGGIILTWWMCQLMAPECSKAQ